MVVHKGLSERVRENHPSTVVIVFSNFMNDPVFDQLVSALKEGQELTSTPSA